MFPFIVSVLTLGFSNFVWGEGGDLPLFVSILASIEWQAQYVIDIHTQNPCKIKVPVAEEHVTTWGGREIKWETWDCVSMYIP